MNFNENFYIENIKIGKNCPTYFIADIAANHDGDLNRAIDLIYKAKEAGADAAKFQHFSAKTIVSDKGFKNLDSSLLSHQASWSKSVFDTYDSASISLKWTQKLVEACKKSNISFFTSPYSIELVDYIDKYVPAYKIGSGDITWSHIIEHISKKNKPVILACGASNLNDIDRSLKIISKHNKNFSLLQCNTNYTASIENFRYVNLNVIDNLKKKYPGLILGLSDHTPGNTTVLGAISKGAKVIEKHFTDDTTRNGPDHKFSMDPNTWKEMVLRSRELESSLGDGIKKVEQNEKDTFVLQRRGIYVNSNLIKNDIILEDNLIYLRPCPSNAIEPFNAKKIIGRKLNKNKNKGDILLWGDIE